MLRGMPPSRDELERLQRLRGLFLDEERGDGALPDYWRTEADLAAYANLLAVRIGWKWQAALDECAARGFRRADDAVVLDYGCGSGIAAQQFVRRFGARAVLCHDRSARAMAFAVRALRSGLPGCDVRALAEIGDCKPDVLLVSHVLGELDARGTDQLLALARRAGRVVVVEAGNKTCARRLSALRAELLSGFAVVAPCPHAAACPALASDRDWCHFFAAPPPEAFTDGEWVRAARALGIDQRALPYSFLALDRTPPATPPPDHRVLGRPAITAHAARLQVCTANGLREASVQKRDDPQVWRLLKKSPASVRTLPPR